MESFDELLEKSTKIHGHICAGQVIGVRLAMLGLQAIGITDPRGLDRKKFYVLVEIDRCATQERFVERSFHDHNAFLMCFRSLRCAQRLLRVLTPVLRHDLHLFDRASSTTD